MRSEHAITRMRQISASLPLSHTGAPEFTPVATGCFCWLSPTNKSSTAKLKCETLEISGFYQSVLCFVL